MKERIIDFFLRDRFAVHAGIKLLEVEPGYALAEMEITDYHYNANDIVQGGAIFTLADLAFAAASNAGGQVTLALNANITYIKPGLGKKLRAEAREIAANKKTAVYNINVFDEDGEIIAQMSGTGYRKKEKIEF